MIKRFVMLCLLSSCSWNNTIVDKYNVVETESNVYFEIYKCQGYFYKNKGFILVSSTGERDVIIKCTIDTLNVKPRRK